MKRLVLSSSVVLALVLACAGVAAAKAGKSYTATSTIEATAKTVVGKITSSKAACLKGRKVQGSWFAPGAHALTEQATSDGSGKWTIDFEVAPGSKGRFGIAVAPKKVGGFTCKGFEAEQEIVVK